jgi:protein-S-isoprenylcysteine O-methyltransferase Ste14
MALQEEMEKQGNWLFRYRSYIPFIVLIAGAWLFVRTELHPEVFGLKGTPYEQIYVYFCLLVTFLGFGIRVFTVGYTPANTSGRNVVKQVADTLNTSGIYSTVRHPLYLGNFFMWLGLILMTGHFWFVAVFIFFYWVYYERIMFAEEQFLRRKFGETYTSWAENVPAFIPRFSQYRKPSLPFSWKKVLKKEKNGFAAIFLLFAFLDVAGELIKGEQNFDRILLGGAIFSAVLYFILKYLKRRTKVLDEEGR